MTVRVYKDTDASAPVLSGQAGALTTLLDAVLVNGYGATTAAGWTIGQTTTNKRQYIQGAGSSGFSLWVDDTAPTTAKEARAAGYQTMSATTPTGTGQFPTSGQSAIGTGMVVIRKSATADSTARKWTIIADATVFYLFAETGDEAVPIMTFPFMFGDFFSYANSDPYACLIIGRAAENSALGGSGSGTIVETFDLTMWGDSSPLGGVLLGHFVASNFNGVGGSINCTKIIDQQKAGTVSSATFYKWGALGYGIVGVGSTTASPGNGGPSVNDFPYPHPVDSGLYVSPVWIAHGGLLRGYLKGLWAPLSQAPLNHNDTYSGTNNLSGKTMLVQSILAGHFAGNAFNKSPGQVHVETSNTWS